MGQTVHTFPVRDVVDHNTESDDCICGPDIIYVGNGGKQVIHHSMDGREHHEDDHDAESCPVCSAGMRDA